MNQWDITYFGATGDGNQDNSAAFASAFGAIQKAGGGTLRVGKGVWITGPLELFSHTTLILEEGAVISFTPEVTRYSPVRTRWEGVECFGFHPLVFASGQEHITIAGKGCFDGSGAVWWKLLQDKRRQEQKTPQTPEERALAALNIGFERQPGGGGGRGMQFLRPPLMQFFKCSHILLEDFTLTNSPCWTLHPVFCDDLTIRGLTIKNPPDAPNTDGIDVDSCKNVVIEGCRVSVGDDGIALKSGSGEDGIRVNQPTCQVRVRNCRVNDAHGGIVIGSETAGGIFDVTAEDCEFTGTDRGIRIKTRRGRGGQIRDLNFRNLTMTNNLCPLAINMYYRCGASMSDGFFTTSALPVNPATPSIKNISVAGIRATGCRASAGFVAGLPESPIENLSVVDSEFYTDETSPVSPTESDMFLGLPEVKEKSFRIFNAREPVFSSVIVKGPKQAFIYG
ncbi:MAG: glycoside hydrolase family 28 protein [Treponema sp.]|jgi:polygalacturonase|nr:glycoside hydrolase family 28 protein [Treponema sp.]